MKTETLSTNFVSVVPDSQFYTDLKQIEATLEFTNHDHAYMLTAIRNTIKMGYKLVAKPIVGDMVAYVPKKGIPVFGKIIRQSATGKKSIISDEQSKTTMIVMTEKLVKL